MKCWSFIWSSKSRHVNELLSGLCQYQMLRKCGAWQKTISGAVWAIAWLSLNLLPTCKHSNKIWIYFLFEGLAGRANSQLFFKYWAFWCIANTKMLNALRCYPIWCDSGGILIFEASKLCLNRVIPDLINR